MRGCLHSRAGADALVCPGEHSSPQESECGAGTVFERDICRASLGWTDRASVPTRSVATRGVASAECLQRSVRRLHALGQGGEEHPCVRRDDKQDE